jgi:hypothetical protein
MREAQVVLRCGYIQNSVKEFSHLRKLFCLLGQGPIFQSLSFYILDKIDTLKNE